MDLAKTLGATHGLNTTSPDFSLMNEIRKITAGQGTNITIDTTGHPGLMEDGLDSTATRGQMIYLATLPMGGTEPTVKIRQFHRVSPGQHMAWQS